MSSYVKQITDSIETKLATLIPAFTKSPYVYSVASNNSKTSSKIFRVIPDSGNSVDGTLRTITIAQKFSVYLTTNYINKNTNDSELVSAIELLYSSLELVSQEAMQRKFAIARVMTVEGFELTSPDIDIDNHTVSIGATYTILYRME